MRSIYGGTCKSCGKTIKVNAEIEKVGLDYVHIACVTAARIAHEQMIAARNAERDELIGRMLTAQNTIHDKGISGYNGTAESWTEMARSVAGMQMLRAWVAKVEDIAGRQ